MITCFISVTPDMGFDGRQLSQGLSARYFVEMLNLANILNTVSAVESYYKSSGAHGSLKIYVLACVCTQGVCELCCRAG